MHKSTKTISGPGSDFVGSSLRVQFVTLGNLLNYIETYQQVEVNYVEESLKHSEQEFHKLRKFCSNN